MAIAVVVMIVTVRGKKKKKLHFKVPSTVLKA